MLTFRSGSISGTPTATATVAEERRDGRERLSAVQAGGLRRAAAGWVRKPSFLRSVVRPPQSLPVRKPRGPKLARGLSWCGAAELFDVL